MNQHQTAHYIEKTGAKWECRNVDYNTPAPQPWGIVENPFLTPKQALSCYQEIRLWLDPITRLPSHLPPYRPDARDPGDGYRVPAKQDLCNQPHEFFGDVNEGWLKGTESPYLFERFPYYHYRLPASVPFPDEAEALADYVEPEVKLASREDSLAAVREQHGEAFQKLAERERLEAELADTKEILRITKAEHERCKDGWKSAHQQSNSYFDQSCKNLQRAEAAEKENEPLRARITELESQLARFQWRSPSQMPMVEDLDANGNVVIFDFELGTFLVRPQEFKSYKILAWMPAPKPPVESDCQRIIRQRGLTEEEVRIIRENK